MKGLISIIVPVYNTAAYLPQCVDSILTQTYKNIEIILVNDGSLDNSGEMCDTYARNDSRVRVIHKENGGVSSARNRGLEAITGEYVMFVDSDDFISPDTCEKVVCAAQKTEADVVFWSYTREYDGKSLPRYIYNNETLFEGEMYNQLFLRLLGDTNRPETLDSLSSCCNKLYRVNGIAESIRFVDTKLIGNEDLLYNLEIFLLSNKAQYLHETFYHYRKSTGKSLTSAYNENFLEKRKNLFKAIKVVLPKNADKSIQNAFDKRIALDLLGQALNVMRIHRGFCGKKALIHNILKDDIYKSALDRLDTRGMKLHWRIYYGFARRGSAFGVTLMSCLIKILKGKI